MPAPLQLRFVGADHVSTMARGSHCRDMWCRRKQAKEMASLMARQGEELSANPIFGASWHTFWWASGGCAWAL